MRPKSLMLLVLALGCGLVASIGISQVMDRNAKQPTAVETTPIYVALHNINLGDPIDAAMVSLAGVAQGQDSAGRDFAARRAAKAAGRGRRSSRASRSWTPSCSPRASSPTRSRPFPRASA